MPGATATTAPTATTIATAALPTDTAPPLDVTQERRGPNRPNAPAMPPELRAIIEATGSHQIRELRRFVSDTLQQYSERIGDEVRAAVRDSPPPAPVVAAEEPPPPRWERRVAPWLVGVTVVAALALAFLQWSQQQRVASTLRAQLDDTQQQLTRTQRSLQVLQAAATASTSAVAAGRPDDSQGASMTDPVPFGDTPLAGVRIDHIAQLLSQLVAQNFHGVIKIRAIPGRYCMVTGPAGLVMQASDTLLYSKCELIGNPRDDSGSASDWQSVAFANMIATARASADGKFDIQVSQGSPDELITSYPAISDALTAGEWNRAAAANNRVEVHWQATP